jgi:hypothetical protein
MNKLFLRFGFSLSLSLSIFIASAPADAATKDYMVRARQQCPAFDGWRLTNFVVNGYYKICYYESTEAN